MFQCHVCGSTELQKKFVREIFWIDGKPVLVEKIPAKVCRRCGEAVFSRQTTEKIRKMVHGESKTFKSIPMDVFEYELEEA
jgi:YgiT-type zinc finger domain-containing protein